LTDYLDNVDSDWFSKRLSVDHDRGHCRLCGILIARLLFLQVIEGRRASATVGNQQHSAEKRGSTPWIDL
jgi:hypothetical protein